MGVRRVEEAPAAQSWARRLNCTPLIQCSKSIAHDRKVQLSDKAFHVREVQPFRHQKLHLQHHVLHNSTALRSSVLWDWLKLGLLKDHTTHAGMLVSRAGQGSRPGAVPCHVFNTYYYWTLLCHYYCYYYHYNHYYTMLVLVLVLVRYQN